MARLLLNSELKWNPGMIAEKFQINQKKMQAETRAAVWDAAQEISEKMKHYIRSRPAKTSGPNGRVDTGRMIDSVGYMVRGGGSWGGAEVGFIHGDEHYFALQEMGFNHVQAKRWVTGMFAFTDAWAEGIPQLRAALHRIVR